MDIELPPCDSLDDGFDYEHVGIGVASDSGLGGYIRPTAFMTVALKELLRNLKSIYGLHGHWLLQEIGADNLRTMTFVDGIGLDMHCRLYDAAVSALPEEDQKRLGYVE